MKHKLTIRRINRNNYLPDECKNRWITLLRTDESKKVIEQQVFYVHSESAPYVPGFTHFILHPYYIW